MLVNLVWQKKRWLLRPFESMLRSISSWQEVMHNIFLKFYCISYIDTLFGETFARETFTNFGLFRESLSHKSFQNGNSRKFIQWNFFEAPIRESLSSEICNFYLFVRHKRVN